MLLSYAYTVRSLNNCKGIEHTGLGRLLPYYRFNAKREKIKYLSLITGIKKDIEINLADIDTNSDIYQLFYLEKDEETTKRWQTELGETLLKRKAENFKINWANLDKSDWNQTQLDATNKGILTSFNRMVYKTRRFYFSGLLPFNYKEMDGLYGSFVPDFKIPQWHIDWNLKPQADIKTYGQTYLGYFAVPSEYMQNIQIGSTPLYRFPNLLLPTPKATRVYNAYTKCLSTVRQNWYFYDMFKLQIYKYGRHDSFVGGQAKRQIKRKRFSWWGKGSRFHYKPTYIRFTGEMFRNKKALYKRFSTVHEFISEETKTKLYYLANEQRSLADQFLPIVVLFGKNNYLDNKIWKKFIKLTTIFNKQKKSSNNTKFFMEIGHIINIFGFTAPTARQQSILISPTIERHWPRIKRFAFPKYTRKFRHRSLSLPIGYKIRTGLQRLSETLTNRSEKLNSYFLKTVLLLVVAHQKLAKLANSNIPKFEPLVNILAAGLVRRIRLAKNIQIAFNWIFTHTFLVKFPIKKNAKNYPLSNLPGQLINSSTYLNKLKINTNYYSFSEHHLFALESLIPVEQLPLLAFIGTHSVRSRVPLDIDTKDLSAFHFSSDLYRQFIGSFGFRYYYADWLPFAMRNSLQFRPTLELNDSKTVLIESINSKLLFASIWRRNSWKINFYRELVRQRIQTRHYVNLFHYHF